MATKDTKDKIKRDKEIEEITKKQVGVTKSLDEVKKKLEGFKSRQETRFDGATESSEGLLKSSSGKDITEATKNISATIISIGKDSKKADLEQLKASKRRLKSLTVLAKTKSGEERELLLSQIKIQREALSKQIGIFGGAFNTITDTVQKNLSDITGVIAGVAADSPIVAAGVGFVGDQIKARLKKRQDEKAEQRKDFQDDAEIQEKESKLLDEKRKELEGSKDGSSDNNPTGETVVTSANPELEEIGEKQFSILAETKDLLTIMLTNDQMVSLRANEEAREKARNDERTIDALENIGGEGVSKKEEPKGGKGLIGLILGALGFGTGGSILKDLKSAFSIFRKVFTFFRKAGPVAEFAGKAAKFLGKAFIIFSVAKAAFAAFDAFSKGGDIGDAITTFIASLIETFTFGFLDIESIKMSLGEGIADITNGITQLFKDGFSLEALETIAKGIGKFVVGIVELPLKFGFKLVEKVASFFGFDDFAKQVEETFKDFSLLDIVLKSFDFIVEKFGEAFAFGAEVGEAINETISKIAAFFGFEDFDLGAILKGPIFDGLKLLFDDIFSFIKGLIPGFDTIASVADSVANFISPEKTDERGFTKVDEPSVLGFAKDIIFRTLGSGDAGSKVVAPNTDKLARQIETNQLSADTNDRRSAPAVAGATLINKGGDVTTVTETKNAFIAPANTRNESRIFSDASLATGGF